MRGGARGGALGVLGGAELRGGRAPVSVTGSPPARVEAPVRRRVQRGRPCLESRGRRRLAKRETSTRSCGGSGALLPPSGFPSLSLELSFCRGSRWPEGGGGRGPAARRGRPSLRRRTPRRAAPSLPRPALAREPQVLSRERRARRAV